MIGLGLGIGVTMARRPRLTPVISITSGSGYAGSTYTSTVAGQWTADGVPITGATGSSYVMSAANEGKAIRCGASNAIQMWTPKQRPDWVWVNPADFGSMVLSASKVVSIDAGNVVLEQSTDSLRFTLTQAGGFPILSAGSLKSTPDAIPLGAAPQFMLLSAPTGYGYYSPAWSALTASDNRGAGLVSESSNPGAFFYNRFVNASGTTDGSKRMFAAVTSASVGATLIKDGVVAIQSTTRNVMPTLSHLSLSGVWGDVYQAIAVPGGDGALSMEDRQAVEGYWGHKFGISGNLPVSHPYKTTAPRVS